jgi:hypothetical protein
VIFILLIKFVQIFCNKHILLFYREKKAIRTCPGNNIIRDRYLSLGVNAVVISRVFLYITMI